MENGYLRKIINMLVLKKLKFISVNYYVSKLKQNFIKNLIP